MDRVSSAGVVLLTAGLAGYGIGVTTPYPGRAFSVTAVTLGVALAVIGPALAGDDGAEVAG